MRNCKACRGSGEVFSAKPYDGSNWIECEDCSGYGIATDPASMRHYRALRAESDRVGWPVMFGEDVTYHDRNALEARDPSLPFIWTLRPSGSHILLTEDRGAREPLRDFLSVVRAIVRQTEPGERCYWWDGRTLSLVSPQDAIDRMEAACHPTERARRAA